MKCALNLSFRICFLFSVATIPILCSKSADVLLKEAGSHDYLHLNYKFNLKGRKGTGELWLDQKHKLARITGRHDDISDNANNYNGPFFGDKTEVSVLVDGEKHRIYTALVGRKDGDINDNTSSGYHKNSVAQCVYYSFPKDSESTKFMRAGQRLKSLERQLKNDVAGKVRRVAERSVTIINDSRVLRRVRKTKDDGTTVLTDYQVTQFQTTFSDDSEFDPPFLPKLQPDNLIIDHLDSDSSRSGLKVSCEPYDPNIHETRLAKFGLGHLRDRSLGLLDLVSSFSETQNASTNREVRFLAALALPGDLSVLLNEPKFEALSNVEHPLFSFRFGAPSNVEAQDLENEQAHDGHHYGKYATEEAALSSSSTTQSRISENPFPKKFKGGQIWVAADAGQMRAEVWFSQDKLATFIVDAKLGKAYTRFETISKLSGVSGETKRRGICVEEHFLRRMETALGRAGLLSSTGNSGASDETSSSTSRLKTPEELFLAFNADPYSGNLADYSLDFSPILNNEYYAHHNDLENASGSHLFKFVGTDLIHGKECFVFALDLWRGRTLKIYVEDGGKAIVGEETEDFYIEGSTTTEYEKRQIVRYVEVVTEEIKDFYGKPLEKRKIHDIDDLISKRAIRAEVTQWHTHPNYRRENEDLNLFTPDVAWDCVGVHELKKLADREAENNSKSSTAHHFSFDQSKTLALLHDDFLTGQPFSSSSHSSKISDLVFKTTPYARSLPLKDAMYSLTLSQSSGNESTNVNDITRTGAAVYATVFSLVASESLVNLGYLPHLPTDLRKFLTGSSDSGELSETKLQFDFYGLANESAEQVALKDQRNIILSPDGDASDEKKPYNRPVRGVPTLMQTSGSCFIDLANGEIDLAANLFESDARSLRGKFKLEIRKDHITSEVKFEGSSAGSSNTHNKDECFTEGSNYLRKKSAALQAEGEDMMGTNTSVTRSSSGLLEFKFSSYHGGRSCDVFSATLPKVFPTDATRSLHLCFGINHQSAAGSSVFPLTDVTEVRAGKHPGAAFSSVNFPGGIRFGSSAEAARRKNHGKIYCDSSSENHSSEEASYSKIILDEFIALHEDTSEIRRSYDGPKTKVDLILRSLALPGILGLSTKDSTSVLMKALETSKFVAPYVGVYSNITNNQDEYDGDAKSSGNRSPDEILGRYSVFLNYSYDGFVAANLPKSELYFYGESRSDSPFGATKVGLNLVGKKSLAVRFTETRHGEEKRFCFQYRIEEKEGSMDSYSRYEEDRKVDPSGGALLPKDAESGKDLLLKNVKFVGHVLVPLGRQEQRSNTDLYEEESENEDSLSDEKRRFAQAFAYEASWDLSKDDGISSDSSQLANSSTKLRFYVSVEDEELLMVEALHRIPGNAELQRVLYDRNKDFVAAGSKQAGHTNGNYDFFDFSVPDDCAVTTFEDSDALLLHTLGEYGNSPPIVRAAARIFSDSGSASRVDYPPALALLAFSIPLEFPKLSEHYSSACRVRTQPDESLCEPNKNSYVQFPVPDQKQIEKMFSSHASDSGSFTNHGLFPSFDAQKLADSNFGQSDSGNDAETILSESNVDVQNERENKKVETRSSFDEHVKWQPTRKHGNENLNKIERVFGQKVVKFTFVSKKEVFGKVLSSLSTRGTGLAAAKGKLDFEASGEMVVDRKNQQLYFSSKLEKDASSSSNDSNSRIRSSRVLVRKGELYSEISDPKGVRHCVHIVHDTARYYETAYDRRLATDDTSNSEHSGDTSDTVVSADMSSRELSFNDAWNYGSAGELNSYSGPYTHGNHNKMKKSKALEWIGLDLDSSGHRIKRLQIKDSRRQEFVDVSISDWETKSANSFSQMVNFDTSRCVREAAGVDWREWFIFGALLD